MGSSQRNNPSRARQAQINLTESQDKDQRRSYLLYDWFENDIPIFDPSVIPLQIDRAGAHWVRPERASGAAQQRSTVDNFFTVQNHCRMAIHQRNIERLPFARRLFCGFSWGYPAVNRAHIVGIEFSTISIRNLDFINAPQIDAAVFPRLHPRFESEIE